MKRVLLMSLVTLSLATANAETIMNQIGTDAQLGAIRASQEFEPVNAAFNVAMIDNFSTSATGFVLTEVRAVVGLFGGTLPPRSFSNITGWRVEIYTAPGAAASNLTGDAGSQTVAPGSVTVDNSFHSSDDVALVYIPVSIVLAPSTAYWLGVIPIMNFGGGFGQTGIVDFTGGGTPGDSNSVQVNPGGGFGLPGGQAARNTNCSYAIDAVPEPASMIALGAGLVGLIARRRRNA